MKQKYKEKREAIQNIKAQQKCAKCGESRGYVLDFHHIDPSIKDNTIARMTSNRYTLNKIQDEMNKCIVLCANCHRQFHYFLQRNNELTIEEYLND